MILSGQLASKIAVEYKRQTENASGLTFQTVQYLFQARELQDSRQTEEVETSSAG